MIDVLSSNLMQLLLRYLLRPLSLIKQDIHTHLFILLLYNYVELYFDFDISPKWSNLCNVEEKTQYIHTYSS